MSYLGNSPEIDASISKYEYTASASQTTFNCVYDTRVDVYLNGVLLSITDYTATSGTDIVLDTGATAGDIIQIDAFQNVTKDTGNLTDFGLFEHSNTISSTYEIQTGNNAVSASPITIGSGASVTVPTGSSWVIV